MKLKNIVKLMFSVFVILSVSSCNYIIKNNKKEKDMITEMHSRVRIHKQEASLLLSISKYNLDVLELCKSIKYADTQKILKQSIDRLEKTHIEISKNYNKVADEALISIPSYVSTINKFELKDIDNDVFIERKLKLIIEKIESQIQLLNTLGRTTGNVDLKLLTIKDTHKLNSNINQIESALNRLDQVVKDI